MSLIDITDRKPNQDTIEILEAALEQAKSGDLRSVVLAKCWANNSTSHSWSLDERTYWRMILAELVLVQHDFTVNLEFRDGDTCLSQALDEF